LANNPRAFDPRVREARQRAYLAVPTLAQQIPAVEEISVELRFTLPSGQPHSSPHTRIFMPDMQAFFELHCPDRDCTKGGFNIGPAIQAAVRNQATSGRLQCQGFKGRDACGLSLQYSVNARLRS